MYLKKQTMASKVRTTCGPFGEMLSGIISSRSGKGSTVVKGPLVDGRLIREACVCFAVDHKAGYKKESSQVFTFNRIGASCATLHSYQETLWHFNSQGNE